MAFYGYGDISGDWYATPDEFYRRQPPVSDEDALKSVGNKVVSNPRGNRWPFYLYCRQTGTWLQRVAGMDPQMQRDAIRQYCPQFNIHKDYPPTLLLHGDADTDVPYQQSADMAAALTRAGISNELFTVAGGGHGFDCDAASPHRTAALDRVIGFLDNNLNR